jgi:hypothetical protein
MVKAEMLDGPHYDYEWCEDMAGTVPRGVFQSRYNLEPRGVPQAEYDRSGRASMHPVSGQAWWSRLCGASCGMWRLPAEILSKSIG